MKKFTKLLGIVLIMALVMSMGTMAFAQTVHGTNVATNTGSITIDNAAKGETYTAYMLFEATLSSDGKIAYKGTVPSGLGDYFEETSTGSGYVQAKPAAFKTVKYYTDATKTTESATATAFWTGTDMSDGLKAALTTWKGSATAVASAVSDGSALTFDQLVLGYYVVTTSQGEQVISVDSTMPDVNIIDKNTTTPSADKTVDGTSYSIGDTITYTGTFDTANYIGDEQVKSYTISDTLPEFLSDVAITSVKIIQSTTDKTTYPDVDLSTSYTAFTDGKIVIPWVDTDGTTNLYKNSSVIQITYTAKLTSTVNVNADNTNTVTITPNKDKDGKNPFDESYHDDAKITTYAAALKKTDGSSALAGAKFKFYGLTVTETASGIYTVVSYDPTAYNTTAGATQDESKLGTEMEVDANGKLYIIGLKEGVSLKGLETEAPDGYNKLTSEVTLTPQKLEEEVFHTEGTRYYDADGNLVSEQSSSTSSKTVSKNLDELDAAAVEVINKSGTELPSTGGIGTTIFYVVGSIMVVAAGVLLVTKKRMSREG